MPLYEYICDKCNEETEILESIEDSMRDHTCPKCKQTMSKSFSKMSFRLKYNNKTDICAWGNEGYATSRYWKDVKDARDRGEKVKGGDEV